MRFFEFFWVFCFTFLVPKRGQREVVCGMPILRGGSENCSLTILPPSAEASSSYVVFRVFYNAETPFDANSSDCKVVYTSGPEKRIKRIAVQGIFQRDVFLSRGKQLRSFIMLSMEKKVEPWLKSQFDSVIWISCPDRKFSCAGFPPNGYDVEHHVSAVRRKLLSAEQFTADQERPIRIPLKPVLLVMVGFLILGTAAGMCANCNEDDSVSQAPHLVSLETRQSERKRGEQEKQVQLDNKRQSNDMIFVESGDKRKEDSVEVAAFTAEEEVAARSKSIKEEDQRQESGTGRNGGDLWRSETSETEHEQHRGKFWKRSRNSNNRNSPSFSYSDTVFQEDGHKDRRSRKPGKVKGKENEESENAERKLSVDSRELFECHSRELPPTPGKTDSAPALPVRPIPRRQFSAPDGSTEENYEEVEARRTKSVDDTDSPYILADDLYDAVRDEVVNVRPSSASYEVIGSGGAGSRGASDIYDEVDEPSIIVDDLYSTVAEAEKEDRELKMRTGSDSYEGLQQEDEEVEYPYSKVNTSEKLELYEEVDKTKENDKFGDQYPAVKTKTDVHPLIVIEVNSGRVRAQSEGATLQRNAVEEPNRPYTIHVMQSAIEKSDTPLDYLYAKVDRSKKLKNRNAAEGSSSQAQTIEEEWGSTSELPPPLPPPYMSSRQVKIEMGWNEEPSAVVVENLYDEVNLGQPTSQMSTKNEDYSRVDNEFLESAQYASVETSGVAHGLNGDVKHEVDHEDEAHYELVTPRAVSKQITSKKQSLTDTFWL